MNATEWEALKTLDMPGLLARFGIITHMNGRGATLFARGLTKDLTEDQVQIICIALLNHFRETTTFCPMTIDLSSQLPY